MHDARTPRSVLAMTVVLSLSALFSSQVLAETPAAPATLTAPQIPALLLVEPRDHTSIDAQIRSVQARLPRSIKTGAELERLGWLFVAKARESSDPGYYTLAGIAADALEKNFGMEQEAWLMRGHVLQTRHRFAEAEVLARRLVAARGEANDFALLGDTLYDQGKIPEAVDAYQKLVDLRPGLDAYARAANIRWLKGDLEGAVTLQKQAVRAGGPRDPGALGWSLVRLGQLLWAQGDAEEATAVADRACELVTDFPSALLLKGRILLSAGHATEALDPLARAATTLPLPEPRWVYAEALRAAGRDGEAAKVETLLVREGIAEDPRTVALFLATRGIDPATAVRLAHAELATRADILTQGANALALVQAGKVAEALPHARAALAEGTIDAHLLLQAGRVLALAHQPDAPELLARVQHLSPVLLPSEVRLLEDSLTQLSADKGLRVAGSTTHSHIQ